MIAENCLMPSPLSTKSIKPIDIELDGRKSPRRGSHGHQSSIVEDHSYTLNIDYRGVDVNTASYSRSLELQVACQVRKGLQPLSIKVSPNDAESFNLVLTLYNHSKSNEFTINFNEHHMVQIFPN